MTTLDELWRTEEYHHHKSTGDLQGKGTTVIGNAAYAARINPIPGILEDILAKPNKQNLQLAHFTLTGHFEKVGTCTRKESTDVSHDVISWWLDPNCHACQGTGVKNKEQETCPVCAGMKEKLPTWQPSLKGIAEVKSLFRYRENQLRAKNRNSDPIHYPHEWDGTGTHVLKLPHLIRMRAPSLDDIEGSNGFNR